MLFNALILYSCIRSAVAGGGAWRLKLRERCASESEWARGPHSSEFNRDDASLLRLLLTGQIVCTRPAVICAGRDRLW